MKNNREYSDIFYSESEKILFIIDGYESTTAKELVSRIENATKFLKEATGSDGDIYTDTIPKSSRYKYMRFYWIKSDVIPKGAFNLDGDWTMRKWITN